MPEKSKCPQCGTPLQAGALAGLCPACLLKQGGGPDTAGPPDQPPFEPPPLAEVARLFPQLELLSLLGKGGMGAVYKARQPALDRVVALKILPSGVATGPGFAERFTREARALARLSHPNIVAVHEFGQADGLHYFVMEFVDGVNLRQLERAGRLSPREALQIIPQICDALQYAHDEGVVHRDIKPENVLVDRKGRVKIADFGLAKILGAGRPDPHLTGEGEVMGTPHYMAPEQVERPLQVDHRADIYSLGVVFYEMLTRELPLGKFAPPSRKVQVDVRLDDVVLHALEKEPDRRYQHASEVKTDVEGIAQTPSPPRATASPPAVARQRHGLQVKSAFFFFAAACFLIAALAFAGRENGIAAMLSVGAAVGFTGAALRHRRAAAAVSRTPGVPASAAEDEANRRQVQGPAIGLLVMGAVFMTPPILLGWFLLSGHRAFGVDLDADVQFWLGVIGMPFSAGLGALLAWMVWMALPAAGALPQGTSAVSGQRWSWQAIVAVALLGLSLPLGGGAAVMLQLIARDGNWNPDTGELVISLGLGGAAVLTAAASLLLGVTALRQMRRAATALRGRTCALAAAWFWPCLLGGTAILWSVDASLSALRGGTPRYAPTVVVRVEEKLTLEITRRLHEAGWKPEGLTVSVSPELKRAVCRFGKVWKNGLSEDTFNAGIQLKPQGPGLWLVEGQGRFFALRFSVDCSEEMAVGRETRARTPEVSFAAPLVGEPESAAQSIDALPPVVVRTTPASGARDVPPGLTELRVTFSKDMADGSWSWSSAWQDSTPEAVEGPRFDADRRTCVLKVKLEPGRTYAYWLNSEKFQNFRDSAGRAAVPYLLIFKTRAEAGQRF
jgi:predicted Ser/Thr protein kinase